MATALSVYPQECGGFLLLVCVSGITDEKSVAPKRLRSCHFFGSYGARRGAEEKIYYGGKGYQMKKGQKIEELLYALGEAAAEADGAPANAQKRPDRARAERRLGAAMLERLSVPEGDIEGFVDSIISQWSAGDALGAEPEQGESAAMPIERAMIGASNAPATEAGGARLPMPMRALASTPGEADYDSMSSEQFRRLKKQLQRAAAEGRRIRL